MSIVSSSAAPAHDAIRVVLADDHAIVREGLKSLVNSQHDMCVIGEAADGEAAVRVARELVPGVLVMDYSMPLLDGAQSTALLRDECPTIRVLALTAHEERSDLARLLGAGVSGYVLKRSAPVQLLHAIRAVAAGGMYVDSAVASTLVRGYMDSFRQSRAASREGLSDRERQVLVGIAQGYSNSEIARDLRLSVKTVETYKARFVEKLGIRTRVEIARYAAEHLSPGDAVDHDSR